MPFRRQLAIADPVGGAPYAYEVTGERRFRLCAVFAADTATKPPLEGNQQWVQDEGDHSVGRQCFDREVSRRRRYRGELLRRPAGFLQEIDR